MILLIYLAQAVSKDESIQFFEWLVGSTPGRIILILGALLVGVNTIALYKMLGSISGNVKSQDDQAIKQLDVISKQAEGLANQSLALLGIRTEIGDMFLRISDDYLAIKTTTEDTQMKIMIHLGEISDSLVELLSLKSDLDNARAASVEATAINIRSAFSDLADTLSSQRAVTLMKYGFVFPLDDDPRWHRAWISPLPGRSAPLFQSPIWHDDAILGEINKPHFVKIIDRSLLISGFYVVIINPDSHPDLQVRAFVTSKSVSVSVDKPVELLITDQ